MKGLKNMPESLEKITDSVRLRPLLWKFLILICVLIHTSAPSYWLKSVAWPVGHVIKFTEWYKVKSCDCSVPYKETKMTQPFTSVSAVAK